MRISPKGRGMLVTAMKEPTESAKRPAEAADESWLVARARRGDRDAFSQLVDRHMPQVWRVVWRIVRHHEDTEDVVQDVFVTAYRGLRGFRGEASLATWLHRIAVTRALNHVSRAAEKIRRASISVDAPVGDSDDTPAKELPAPSATTPSPLQQLEAKELWQRLARCLERVPATWRAVLTLRDGESLSYEDIARTLSLALGTVRSRLARARTALRRCLEEEAA
ncbi:MAG: sigma-70 family RNA polymerase sigma factor [Acidobacteriota bacterium]|nr:MAG: sigma-70 family RNA polymerase sigma factor [Acidobacteriota bacterium]